MNTWRMDVKDVLDEIEKFGFKRVLDVPFMNDENTIQEHLYVYFCEKYGILLEFDTYSGNHVNGGLYHYQWTTKTGEAKHNYALSSGGWEKKGDVYIWEGHGDVRHDMFESITQLMRDGKFVTPWIGTCKIFVPTFVHYMDHHSDGTWDEGYALYEKALREKTPERFRMLPENVQKAIENNMRFNRSD